MPKHSTRIWRRVNGVIALTVLLSVSFAQAAPACRQVFNPEFLFGLEFTVTSQEIVDEGNSGKQSGDFYRKPLKEKAWRAFIDRLKAECVKTGDCITKMSSDKHGTALKVIFPDGFYLTIGSDSAVLEINAKPQTVSQFDAARVQRYALDLAREVGLTPHERAGGGHIHISRKAFNENALLFRNFFVDFQNRPELAYGALGNHLGNSAPVAALKSRQRDALEQVLSEFDPNVMRINDLIARLHSEVFTDGYISEWGAPTYYQAFNMTRMMNSSSSATLEIRSFRPQESAHAYVLQTKLLLRWIEKLSSLSTEIQYIRKDKIPAHPQEIVDSFAQLLRDLDLKFEEYRILLPPRLRSLDPSARPQGVPYSLKELR